MAPNVDDYNREITYLRVSVIDRCNLRCIYCQPVKNLKLLHHADILTYEEILRVVEAATQMGISKVRVTGGEPLIRRNLLNFLFRLCRMPGLNEVSITTNGVLLKQKAKAIFDAGVRRLNVSLDTLNPLKYAKITGRPCFEDVWGGLEAAEAIGFSPIKLNVVAMRGVNDNEFRRFAELSVRKPYHVRFIEYMPVGLDSQWKPEKYISSDEIKCKLESFGTLHKIPRSPCDGPAERYRFESARGEIGFISALSHHFCPSCNRLRLLSDGKLRPCLFSDEEVDIKTALRSGCSQEDIKALFHEAISRKPERHHAEMLQKGAELLHPMSAIGG
ncbi:MAG: GTP 3',8-cyclase MoaA [Desulfobacterales bacterium]|nr:MAG: GTP 3',8-cyclase MoaA [Desulfobacterales bacterium]